MKVGSASWIIRGTYLENSVILDKHCNFVELLVYSWNTEIRDLLKSEFSRLKDLSLFYTVHLPLDNMKNCSEAYAFFKENHFPVKSYNLHPLKGWEKFIWDKPDVILENLIDICVPFERMCVDIGHLKLSKKEDYLLNNPELKIIKEMHIHGIVRNKDHCVLNSPTFNYIKGLKNRYTVFNTALENKNTLLTFEIFDINRLLISLKRINSCKFLKLNA